MPSWTVDNIAKYGGSLKH